jgi:hypothetical protein
MHEIPILINIGVALAAHVQAAETLVSGAGAHDA